MSTTVPVEITLEFTPNPETLKYALNRRILLTGAEYYVSIDEAEHYSPLATKLFTLGNIGAVMIGADFVTVTLESHDNLRELNRDIMQTIKEHLESGELICVPRDYDLDPEECETSREIRRILDEEIRPQVAMDGGDIVFQRYEDGVVYLHMMGACSGCPSSLITLKQGIQGRLQSVFPDIREVVPV